MCPVAASTDGCVGINNANIIPFLDFRLPYRSLKNVALPEKIA
jgi:hypothetical protein